MLTREQIEESQSESREKGIPIKNLLKSKGIPEHRYFWWKRKYSKTEVPEGFLPVTGGGLPAAMPAYMSGAVWSSTTNVLTTEACIWWSASGKATRA